jgi:hypothetical protein
MREYRKMMGELGIVERFSKYFASVTLAALVVVAVTESASAISFSFAFSDGPTPSTNFYGRTHVPGTVTGVLFGLSDNTFNELPTQIEITSDESALGVTNNQITTFDYVIGSGFDVVAGTVVGANLLVNFTDPVSGPRQLRFNFSDSPGVLLGANWLIWNGGNSPANGTGNEGEFAGASYAQTAPVPGPIVGAGLPGVVVAIGGFFGWRRRKQATA